MNITSLERAIKIAGGQTALGRACGASQAHVWWWLNRSKRVPAEFVLSIEAATKGFVTRHELRPDIYPIVESPTAAASPVATTEPPTAHPAGTTGAA